MKTVDERVKREYVYSGPVLKFGSVVANNWHGSTFAVSEKQATNNLVYQFKKQYGIVVNIKVSLAGTPVLAGC